MYTLTEKLISEPGYHDKSGGGSDWENNINSVQDFGLASDYLTLEKDKIDAISTTGDSSFNYSQFKNVSDIENQYNIEFKWLPVVETSKSFTRNQSPSKITEPDSDYYERSSNEVHYGSLRLNGSNYNFLVTAHDGIYNTTRVRENDWNFLGEPYYGENDYILLDDYNFTVERFQNREDERGASLILGNTIKSFGPNPEGVDQSVIKLNRYAALDVEDSEYQPVRMEVLSW
jgi:hypothetical protein